MSVRIHRGFGFLQRAASDKDGESNLHRFIAANEGPQADGLDLRMKGARLDRYRANPVVMYGHDYWGRNGLPIGRTETITVDGKQLPVDIGFDADDEFGMVVDRKLRGGYLNAVSVGFIIHAMDSKTGVVDDWELLEISVVPIPMDPAAVADPSRDTTALARALIDLAKGPQLLAPDTDTAIARRLRQLRLAQAR